jgi:hypothetical protein
MSNETVLRHLCVSPPPAQSQPVCTALPLTWQDMGGDRGYVGIMVGRGWQSAPRETGPESFCATVHGARVGRLRHHLGNGEALRKMDIVIKETWASLYCSTLPTQTCK